MLVMMMENMFAYVVDYFHILKCKGLVMLSLGQLSTSIPVPHCMGHIPGANPD